MKAPPNVDAAADRYPDIFGTGRYRSCGIRWSRVKKHVQYIRLIED
jgi:hypothetical protein